MLNQAKGLMGVTTINLGGLEWVSGENEDSLDRVIIRQAIHHMQIGLEDFCRELFRVLKPEGRIVISKRGDLEQIFPWPKGFYEKMAKEEFSLVQIEEIFIKSGFRRVEMTRSYTNYSNSFALFCFKII